MLCTNETLVAEFISWNRNVFISFWIGITGSAINAGNWVVFFVSTGQGRVSGGIFNTFLLTPFLPLISIVISFFSVEFVFFTVSIIMFVRELSLFILRLSSGILLYAELTIGGSILQVTPSRESFVFWLCVSLRSECIHLSRQSQTKLFSVKAIINIYILITHKLRYYQLNTIAKIYVCIAIYQFVKIVLLTFYFKIYFQNFMNKINVIKRPIMFEFPSSCNKILTYY